jgi:hypothetical protein
VHKFPSPGSLCAIFRSERCRLSPLWVAHTVIFLIFCGVIARSGPRHSQATFFVLEDASAARMGIPDLTNFALFGKAFVPNSSLPANFEFSLGGLSSPATVSESIFVFAEDLHDARAVSYFIDSGLVVSESKPPFWMGGQIGGVPNGFSINSAGVGHHILSAVATLANGRKIQSNKITLNVIPSINGTLHKTLTSYPNELSAQLNSAEEILRNVSTRGASLTPQEEQTRQQVVSMCMNWGIDVSLDYVNDKSSVLAAMAPQGWNPPPSMTPGENLSMVFSSDSPAYQRIPAVWPRVSIPSGYFRTVQLNTTPEGDGLGYGEVIASPNDYRLPIRSQWYSIASTLAIFKFPMPANWAESLPTQSVGDRHMIFVDPASQTFVSAYKVMPDPVSAGPDALYASSPTPFNSLGDRGGSTASSFAELPFIIQPGEATNAQKPIAHAIGGAVSRVWAARVYPASARDSNVLTAVNRCKGRGYANTGLVPYGGLIQLDPQLNLGKLNLSLPAFRILQAMQTYGYYVMDFGCADLDIYTSLSEAELNAYGGLYGYNKKGLGVQTEIESVLRSSKLYVLAPLTKKQ